MLSASSHLFAANSKCNERSSTVSFEFKYSFSNLPVVVSRFGNLINTAGLNLELNSAVNNFAWVDLPVLSNPSNTIKAPLVLIFFASVSSNDDERLRLNDILKIKNNP